MVYKKILHLTKEEYEKLVKGELKLKTKPKLRFKRFKLARESLRKVIEFENSGC